MPRRTNRRKSWALLQAQKTARTTLYKDTKKKRRLLIIESVDEK